MKQMLKDTLILFIIPLISGIALGAVYLVTKEPIAEQQEKKKAKAYQVVFTDAASFEDEENFDVTAANEALAQVENADYSSEEIIMFAKALDANGELLGHVITVTTHAGYGGDITFSMGIRLDGTLNGISITEINETAGLGMKAPQELAPQFANKATSSRFTVIKTEPTYPSEIDAISGATITTDALTGGVNAGVAYWQYRTGQNNGTSNVVEGGVRNE